MSRRSARNHKRQTASSSAKIVQLRDRQQGTGTVALSTGTNGLVTSAYTSASMAASNAALSVQNQFGQHISQHPYPDMPKISDTKPLLDSLGATGTAIFGGIITSEEYNPDFYWRDAVNVFEQMLRNDGQIVAIRQQLELPLRRATWAIKPASDDPKDHEIASFVETSLFHDMQYTTSEGRTLTQKWDDILRHILMHLWFGFMAFEVNYRIEDGWVKWARWTPLLPRTIWRWWVGEDTELVGIQQWTFKDYGYRFVDIPADKLLLFVNRQEGNNFEGVSLLRAAYKHWYYKDQFYKIDAIGLERNAISVPVIRLPESDANEAAVSASNSILANLRANESMGVTLPPQWDIEYIKNNQKYSAQVMPSIQHHDTLIARSVLAQFIQLGSTETGAYALADAQIETFLEALQTVAEYVEDVINSDAIPRLVDYNFDGVAVYPRLTCSKLAAADIKDLSSAIAQLTAGPNPVIKPDDDLEDWMRSQFGLPSANRSVVNATNPTAPSDPARPDGERASDHSDQESDPTPETQQSKAAQGENGDAAEAAKAATAAVVSTSEDRVGREDRETEADDLLSEARLLREALASAQLVDAVERGLASGERDRAPETDRGAYQFFNPNHLPPGPKGGEFAPKGGGGGGEGGSSGSGRGRSGSRSGGGAGKSAGGKGAGKSAGGESGSSTKTKAPKAPQERATFTKADEADMRNNRDEMIKTRLKGEHQQHLETELGIQDHSESQALLQHAAELNSRYDEQYRQMEAAHPGEDIHARAARMQAEDGLRPELTPETARYQQVFGKQEPVLETRGTIARREIDVTRAVDPYLMNHVYGEDQLGMALSMHTTSNLREAAKVAGVKPGRTRAETISRITAKVTGGRYSANFGHAGSHHTGEDAFSRKARAYEAKIARLEAQLTKARSDYETHLKSQNNPTSAHSRRRKQQLAERIANTLHLLEAARGEFQFFNQNHDPTNGRFTSGAGAGGISSVSTARGAGGRASGASPKGSDATGPTGAQKAAAVTRAQDDLTQAQAAHDAAKYHEDRLHQRWRDVYAQQGYPRPADTPTRDAYHDYLSAKNTTAQAHAEMRDAERRAYGAEHLGEQRDWEHQGDMTRPPFSPEQFEAARSQAMGHDATGVNESAKMRINGEDYLVKHVTAGATAAGDAAYEAHAEAAGAEMGEALGFGHTSVESYAFEHHGESYVAVKWQDGYRPVIARGESGQQAVEAFAKSASESDLRDMTIHEYLTADPDRHGMNTIYNPTTGRSAQIDFGRSFPQHGMPGASLSSVTIAAWATQHGGDLNALRFPRDYLRNIVAREPAAMAVARRYGLTPAARAALHDRFQSLAMLANLSSSATGGHDPSIEDLRKLYVP